MVQYQPIEKFFCARVTCSSHNGIEGNDFIASFIQVEVLGDVCSIDKSFVGEVWIEGIVDSGLVAITRKEFPTKDKLADL